MAKQTFCSKGTIYDLQQLLLEWYHKRKALPKAQQTWELSGFDKVTELTEQADCKPLPKLLAKKWNAVIQLIPSYQVSSQTFCQRHFRKKMNIFGYVVYIKIQLHYADWENICAYAHMRL